MISEGHVGNKGGKGGFYRYTNPADSNSRQTLDFDSFRYRDYDNRKPAVAIAAERDNDFTRMLDSPMTVTVSTPGKFFRGRCAMRRASYRT